MPCAASILNANWYSTKKPETRKRQKTPQIASDDVTRQEPIDNRKPNIFADEELQQYMKLYEQM